MIRKTKKHINSWKKALLHKYFYSIGSKPNVINFLANDICNSKCTMCNIWKQKKGFEISGNQLRDVLKNKLFSKVYAVGVTGGEPTLRKDLPDLYDAICSSLPNLQGTSIITNAIRKDEVIERVEASYRVVQRYNKKFGMMVSLDGYSEIHDLNRGRDGNFKTAMDVIKYFKRKDAFKVVVGCTITKNNLWGVDKLLDFLVEENVSVRFRIAEFIIRLYNTNLKNTIRNFTPEEKYHLSSFYQRLIAQYEKNPMYLRTYKNIIGMLNGNTRQMNCPYQKKGIVLDSTGQILYCAPKSKKLGSVIEGDAWKLYQSNLNERKRIHKHDCDDCIHDYHTDISVKQLSTEFKEKIYKRLISLKHHKFVGLVSLRKSPFTSGADTKKIFITGWYGTETVGDKAILMGIVEFYKKKFSKIELVISAIIPYHTKQTLREHDLKATIVFSWSSEFLCAAKYADITVMGGGPLMEIVEIALPLIAFKIAKKYKKKTVVFGCGIGPLYQEKYLSAVRKILQYSDIIRLRDSASVEWCKRLWDKSRPELYGDPAHLYIRGIAKSYNKTKSSAVLGCFLREWPKIYKGDFSDEEYEELKEKFESNLAQNLKTVCKAFRLVPHFYCMHTFVVGGDDRFFYRRFVKKYFVSESYYIEEHPSSVTQIVKAMKESSFNICMRFHSVLFAHTLETNFLAIDYTLGGKIHGYITDNEEEKRLLGIEEIATQGGIMLERMAEL